MVNLIVVCISCTLRSWVHEIFPHYSTFSPRLGDNCVPTYSSDSFSHTKYLSSCMKNSQNHTLMFCCSPILGRRFEKQRKLWNWFVPQFFSIYWPSTRAWRQTLLWNAILRVFHTRWYIFCVFKIVRTTFCCIVVSRLQGDCSIMWENCMDQRSESAMYRNEIVTHTEYITWFRCSRPKRDWNINVWFSRRHWWGMPQEDFFFTRLTVNGLSIDQNDVTKILGCCIDEDPGKWGEILES